MRILFRIFGLFLHEFIPVEHAQQVDGNLPLIVDKQCELFHPSQHFLNQNVLLQCDYFGNFIP